MEDKTKRKRNEGGNTMARPRWRSDGLDRRRKDFLCDQGRIAADEIIALGRKSPGGLIAMCSHGRSGVNRWVLGNVAETVVRHTGDPVLVLRAGS